LNDVTCGPSPCSRCYRLLGGASLPRLLWPLCADRSRASSKLIILVSCMDQEESGQVPGSCKGTLTSEGRLPSAFPRMRA